MQTQFAPSILSLDLTKAYENVSELIKVGARTIHLDIMDGHFVPYITFGHQLVEKLPKDPEVLYEAHLMVSQPQNHFIQFIDAGCKRIIFHQEATLHSWHLIDKVKKMGCEVGIAINPGTSVELIKPILSEINLVLIMTVNPGWGGQSFVSFCLEKAKQVKTWNPQIIVEIDGGVDEKIAPLAQKAGVDIMVVGSRFIDPKGFEHVWKILNRSIL